MALVNVGLAVEVAPLIIKAAAVREGEGREQQAQKEGDFHQL